MTAGVLYHLGVHMGDYFTKVDKKNPNGFFENLVFTNAHSVATSTMTFNDIVKIEQ